MAVRAKFRVEEVDQSSVRLRAVSGGSDENREFFTATPSGLIDLQVLNPHAIAAFDRGAEYYVDFIRA
jgi:hypothetical protein